MAKLTALEIVNKVLNNLGESSVNSLSSLSGLSFLVFNTINECLHEIATEYKLKPLEASLSLTMVTNTSTYALPADFQTIDKDSLKYNNQTDIVYLTPQSYDRGKVNPTTTGQPAVLYQWGEVFNVWPIPNAGANTKVITGRYWKVPTLYSTATETGTSYMPQGFDLTLLADLATYKILHYKQNAEAATYYLKVYGDKRVDKEGSLDKFKNLYGSPDILDGHIFTEPMENTPSNGRGFTQQPITG